MSQKNPKNAWSVLILFFQKAKNTKFVFNVAAKTFGLCLFPAHLFFSCANKKIPNNELLFVVQNQVNNKTYYNLVNNLGDTVLRLHPDKYWACFSDTVKSFLVVAPKDRSGLWAIDFQEKYLFELYNTSPGEPSPDELICKRIRIVDRHEKIGYADENGKVLIPPQFEAASEFFNDKAIVGVQCAKIPWKGIEQQESDCVHYEIECTKNGYIDNNGKILYLGTESYNTLRHRLTLGNK